MIDVNDKKNRILRFLEGTGPSLPVRIARSIEMDPMFASAIMSDLISSKQILSSNLKVGASPLYFLPGQESMLENFSGELKSVEKVAFDLLKGHKVLMDEDLEPAIRVALRSIRDFAVPFKYKERIMWRYRFVSPDDVQKVLSGEDEKVEEEGSLSDVEEREEEVIVDRGSEDELEEVLEEEVVQEVLEEEKEKEVEDVLREDRVTQKSDEVFEEKVERDESVPKAWEKKKEEVKVAKEKSFRDSQKNLEDIFSEGNDEIEEPEFLKEVKVFLGSKGIEFLREVKVEKKEIIAEVGVSSGVGEIIFMMTARDKKTISKDDIGSAFRMARNSNVPCLLVIRKEPSRSIQKILSENNLIKLIVMK